MHHNQIATPGKVRRVRNDIIAQVCIQLFLWKRWDLITSNMIIDKNNATLKEVLPEWSPLLGKNEHKIILTWTPG